MKSKSGLHVSYTYKPLAGAGQVFLQLQMKKGNETRHLLLGATEEKRDKVPRMDNSCQKLDISFDKVTEENGWITR